MKLISNFANRIPTRLVVGVMIFLAGLFAYMLTFNFSISLLAMVEARPKDHNGTMVEMPDFGPRYPWTAYEQSLVVGAYFYGNVLSSVPSGLLVQHFGWAKASILCTFILCVLLTVLSPLAASLSFGAMFTVRFIIGALQGGLYPAYTYLISKWAPPTEVGLFTISNMGANLGTVLTWSLSGVIVETIGWASTFYITGAIAGAFAVSWTWLVYDEPAVHPRISPTERAFIETSMHDVSEVRPGGWPPLWSMAKSVPFWTLFVLQFGNCWGSIFVLTAVPKFLNEVLGFQIASTGFLSSLPYILRTVVSLFFGYIDQFVAVNYPNVSTTVWRKVFCIFSHIIPGMILVAMPFFVDQPYVCVALMTLSYGINGAVSVTVLTNYHDLSPNYATTLNALINGLGNSAGFLSPLVVAFFTEEKNTIDEWRWVFVVGAAVYIIPAIMFTLGGSGQVQKWNEPNVKPIAMATLEHEIGSIK